MINCWICNTKTKNKKYCSEPCQYEGYRRAAERVTLECKFCKKKITVRVKSLKLHPKKYCSRYCKDIHQKELYRGVNNPSFNRTHSIEERKRRSDSIKAAYKNDPSIKDGKRAGVKKYVEKTGYYPGTDPISIEKKKKTNLQKYGVEWAGWNVPEIKQKADDTCVKRYGKTSLELMQAALLNTTQTKPEQIVQEYLEKLKINFIPQYKLTVDNVYRHFDFMLVDFNILLEIDGDFWHANPSIYDRNNLHEVQIRTLNNDIIKNEMVRKTNIKLIRFWESEVTVEEFFEKLKEVLYEESTSTKS